ncbi:MAG TPA: benzoate/H(+) symporter BenE family transporter, partial [Roseiarcus sp.]
VLRSQGYKPDVQKLFTITGLSSMAGAVGGGGLLSLAAITAALTAGTEAHPDPNKRYISTMVAGVAYILLGLASPLAAALIVAAPTGAIKAVAGLALMTSFAGALATSLQKPDERVAVIATFVVSASGVSLFGVGASFWGLIVGGLLLFSETWRR